MRTLDLTCIHQGCPAKGRITTVHPTLAGLGVYAMPTYLCAECGYHMQQVGGWAIGEVPCPGSNSSISPETPPESDSGSAPSHQRTARATGRRSTTSRATGTARSAAGSNPGTGGDAA
jgi:hypothetical protein